MNSEERRGEVYEMLARVDHLMEYAERTREEMFTEDSDGREKYREEQILSFTQRYRDAEECLIESLGKDQHEAYLRAKSKLLWEHGKQID